MRTGAVILAVTSAATAQTIRLNPPSLAPLEVRANLVANSSFETVDGKGMPKDWIWDRRNTDATCRIDTSMAHTGKRSLELTNGTAFGAHIYGLLRSAQPGHLQPGKAYTLSAYVRSDDPGIAWVGGGSTWQYRLRFPATNGRWQRVWMTFKPSEADRDFVILISTENPTKGIWIDDLKLEEGESPTPDATPDKKALLEPLQAEVEVSGDGPFEIPFNLVLPQRSADLTLRAMLDRPATEAKAKLTVEAGAVRLRITGEAFAASDSPDTLTVSLSAGTTEIASAETTVRFYSSTSANKRLDALAPMIAPLTHSLDAARAAGQDTAYPQATLTVLENFIEYARDDLKHNEVRRALAQIADLEAMAARVERELAEVAKGKRTLPEVPRWTGSKRSAISGPSFIAPVIYPSRPSAPVDRPVFFYGYGHFAQAQADIEKFPSYGVNIIQCEFGPNGVYPAEGRVSDEPVKHVQRLLDRGSKAGVAVCLLISPHYFPEWTLAKYPHLRKKREGFLQYCLHAPEGQELLKQYIARIIPPIKDHPALHSICLSNEPVNAEEACDFARAEFHKWLERRHRSVATLNARWGTQFARIEDVPAGDSFSQDSVPPPCWYDFVRFNQEWFAGWHRMMADAIRAIAPNLPVHAKGMTWTMIGNTEVRYGVDAELFGGFSQINGNDSVNFYNHETGEFAQEWRLNAIAYDLQRSVKDAPVCNTENHIIVDRETRPIPPEHIRTALWQGAIHGQSATTIWVWERSFDPKSDTAGSIMHRPACVEAAGHTTLDLNRLAEEVTAIQRLKPQVAIVHSVSGLVWDGGRYVDCAQKLYMALSFTGLKIGFVTERQLERGEVPAAPVLFVPNLIHFSEDAAKTLRHYTGQLVLLDEGSSLSRDEYDHERRGELNAQHLPFHYGKTTWKDLAQSLRPKLSEWQAQPPIQVLDPQGQPVTGVAWLCADSPEGTIVNLCNYGRKQVHITLRRRGQSVTGQDLLSGETISDIVTMDSLKPRLVRIGAK